MENVKSGSERPKGAGRSLSSPPGPNRDPTTYGDSSLTHPVSDWMHFGNCTLRTSGEAEGSVPGSLLVLVPRNRSL